MAGTADLLRLAATLVEGALANSAEALVPAAGGSTFAGSRRWRSRHDERVLPRGVLASIENRSKRMRRRHTQVTTPPAGALAVIVNAGGRRAFSELRAARLDPTRTVTIPLNDSSPTQAEPLTEPHGRDKSARDGAHAVFAHGCRRHL